MKSIACSNNPTLFVRRGQTYTLHPNTPNHPFYLQTTGNGFQSADMPIVAASLGMARQVGSINGRCPQDAPDELFYQCKFHSVMFGKIIVSGLSQYGMTNGSKACDLERRPSSQSNDVSAAVLSGIA